MTEGGQESPVRVSLDLDSARAKEFITKLTRDQHFRRRLETEPKAVLEEYGISMDGPFHYEKVALPPRALMEQIYHAMFDITPNPPWFGPAGIGILTVALAVTTTTP
jgi:hypothetical protein